MTIAELEQYCVAKYPIKGTDSISDAIRAAERQAFIRGYVLAETEYQARMRKVKYALKKIAEPGTVEGL